MQLPETPPPPLAPLWDRVLRARALPPDLDVELLYVAIRDRLTRPEWEVRLHALRVLADLLPLSGNALSFPFDQVVDNLGHGSPNVRKAALDSLKVFCTHCEDSECAARAILDKCSYNNIRPHSANIDTKINVITGLILSIPSLMGILKRRNPALDIFPVFETLGEKLFDHSHRDVAQRSLLKLRRICVPRDYMMYLSRLDPKTQEKFRSLCETYDEDSLDVYYAPRRSASREHNYPVVINHVFNGSLSTPIRISTESSSEESFDRLPFHNSNYAKVIIETEIKFDSDTAITMTVLEENETESEKNTISEEDYDSSDLNMLRYSDRDSEDTDVVVKKVRFGGESVKIRTPDSDNLTTSEEDNRNNRLAILEKNNNLDTVSTEMVGVVAKFNDKSVVVEKEPRWKPTRKSGIPLPVIQHKSPKQNDTVKYNSEKIKSKSLSELYEYFRVKNDNEGKLKDVSGFALTLSEVRTPEKVPSPVESHREIEVLHNLQRSPVVSPRRHQTQLEIEHNGFYLSLLSSSPRDDDLSPRPPTPLQPHYDWEDFGIVPQHVADQLHNTENWIAAVKAADQLHSTLLEAENVRRLEPAALSLVQHMWALSDAVSAARAPAEGAVCALVRSASPGCARWVLPALISRMAREPPPAALPHALLQRLALHQLIDLIFDPTMIGISGSSSQVESAQLRAALCVARAAGPAAVLSAVRRRLAGTARADHFCNKVNILGELRSKHVSQRHLISLRRRARSTPPPPAPMLPRRLRPLPDSAPLPSISQVGNELILKTLSPIPFSDRDSVRSRLEDSRASSKAEVTPDEKINTDELLTEQASLDERSRSQSAREEDKSERSEIIVEDVKRLSPSVSFNSGNVKSSRPPTAASGELTVSCAPSRSSSPRPRSSRAGSIASLESGKSSPRSASGDRDRNPPADERDVRAALAECILPARHEDWEAIVTGLTEIERLAEDPTARAPASSWRVVTRNTATHVRSLRSRVARCACRTLGSLFEHRGRALDPELEEAASALLDRCADVNRFLRGDAAESLARVACGGALARAAVALARRGAKHRAGPVRGAAAAALARLARRATASRVLDLPVEPRTVILRAAGDLLGDANAEARMHARHLCLVLSEDTRFRALLKEATPPTRYRNVEKLVEKLRFV
ncbi:hypothetical protein K1T71_008580 [Dendrolimus kikuchii]|uniref:Uncharacterized protein n=1 Tax=Dendrolimus kikuchii TaxID=765133 RepID=A0ACC1CV20_9NEOP|nr:hypothetical protein K1T71_008580 [Dendrolimus kikuchii]